MHCGICNTHTAECTCADLNDRMRRASDGQHIAVRWCKACDSYYSRCTCEKPEWRVRVGGKLVPTEAFGFTFS